MDAIKNTLMVFVSTVTYISYFPQIVKLYQSKSSKDLSLPTLTLWVLSSFAYMLYAWLEGYWWVIFLSTSSFIFNSLTLFLAVRYSRSGL